MRHLFGFGFSEENQVARSCLRTGYSLSYFGLGIGCAGKVHTHGFFIDLIAEPRAVYASSGSAPVLVGGSKITPSDPNYGLTLSRRAFRGLGSGGSRRYLLAAS
jgi:hypothetical protein